VPADAVDIDAGAERAIEGGDIAPEELFQVRDHLMFRQTPPTPAPRRVAAERASPSPSCTEAEG
jgi:hypothetical protein